MGERSRAVCHSCARLELHTGAGDGPTHKRSLAMPSAFWAIRGQEGQGGEYAAGWPKFKAPALNLIKTRR